MVSFGKVWGFLKYYHPNVVNGQKDWDKEFIEKLSEIQKIESQKELNQFYIGWIQSLGNIKTKKNKKSKGKIFEKNFDLSWIDQEFSDEIELINLLRNIEKNRVSLDNKALFKEIADDGFRYFNEKSYPKDNIGKTQYRLLDLLRYWNIIEYFFPYKYMIDQNWDEVLAEMIPRFVQTKSEKDYTLLLYELFAKINDGHASFISDCTPNCFGEFWVPFSFTLIDNKIVINGFYNKDKTGELQNGDIILKIGNEEARKALNENLKYASGSNLYGMYRSLQNKLFNGDSDKINLTIQRGNEIIHQDFQRFKYEEFNFQNSNPEIWKILENNIGYVNIGNLENKDIEEMYNALKETKAIIFDVRNYPKGTIVNLMKKLSPNVKNFSSYTIQDFNYPGKFVWREKFSIEKNNKNPYSGKIVILANEKTQSQAETVVMALQTLENSTTIGSQTAGANGNVSIIPMTFEGMETWISGIGFYYSDGSDVQRKGVKIDIESKPTIEGITKGKDEVLERAIQFIETGK